MEGAKEDKAGWSGFLHHLKTRGLRGIRLIISDACMGLVDSVEEYFQEARWQRCTVLFYRNVFSVVPHRLVGEVAAMLKAVHASEDLEAAQEKVKADCEKLRMMKLPKAAEKVEASMSETPTYYYFPREHWSRIRTNNALERIMKEIRRQTKVSGAFPDCHSALMLCAA